MQLVISAQLTRTVIVSAVASNSDNIYFENGTCKCPNATAGDTADINGVTYTVVNDYSIAGEIANGNVNLCTTLQLLEYGSSCFKFKHQHSIKISVTGILQVSLI